MAGVDLAAIVNRCLDASFFASSTIESPKKR
jgi:hypothetical protein